MKNTFKLHHLLLAGVMAASGAAHAALVNLGPGSFAPEATAITFSEAGRNIGDVDPVYNFVGLPGLGNVTVSFGGIFAGQSVTGGSPVTLDDTSPSGPLTLAGGPPVTSIQPDGANPTSPVLSGTPTYNGPISVLFSVPVAGVGLDGGFFDAIGATTIEAFDSSGTSLGSIVNSQLGIEFFGLADSTGANVISGISFYITGNEPAGFAIDNLTFGAASVITDPNVRPPTSVPEGGSTLISLGAASLALCGLRHLRRSRPVR